MPNLILVKDAQGTTAPLRQVRFAHGSFSPADAGTDFTIGTPLAAAITQNALANGAARQSAKVDLGDGRPRAYAVLAAIDSTGETPSATGYVDYYWAPSTHATTGTGNVASNSGNDAAAPDGGLGSITLAEFLLQCDFIGRFATHDGAVVQNGLVSPSFVPSSRYGQLIIVNNTGDVFEVTDAEMACWFNPLVDEVQ
jgi:hypothetical protein